MYCKRQGYDKTAEIADQIDRVLCYLYGKGNTKEWEDVIVTSRFGITEDGGTELLPQSVYDEIVSTLCLTCDSNIGCFAWGFRWFAGDDLIVEFIKVYSEELEKYLMS